MNKSDTCKVKVDRDGTYLIASPVRQLKKGFAAEIFYGGRTDEMATMLAEAMVIHPWIRIALVYAVVEFKRLSVQRQNEVQGFDVGAVVDELEVKTIPGQLAMFE